MRKYLPVRFFLIHIVLFLSISFSVNAQNDIELIQKVKAKLDKVTDYVADGTMKIDVAFINAPQSKVKIYYKKPDHFRVIKDGGISILPKGGVNVNLSSALTTENFVVVPAGETMIGNSRVRILKLLPLDENSDVVLTTIYIDETNLLVRRSRVTTRESGTYEMELLYGKYSNWGLPDKVIFSFNTKDYKLPKGVTFEYQSGAKPKQEELIKNKKGKVEISYSSYRINMGISDAVFKE